MSWSAIAHTFFVLSMIAWCFQSYHERSGWWLFGGLVILMITTLLFGFWLGTVSKP